ncbi:MAG: hypothetical protein V4672_17200 [Verrucomicrobiota bacterium]
MKRILSLMLLLAATLGLHAQEEADGEGTERVQYALILPDEKTPELVKPEENNPFEMAADGAADDEGDTEENQVRDMLLRMPVGGAVSGLRGVRVMLGGMRLEQGMNVPPVIPDQQVTLRVKSITSAAIELVWVEKKPTGLPPKLLVIPVDGSPSVRYRMPTSPGADPAAGGSMGTVRRPDVSALSRPVADGEPTVARAQPAEAPPATTPPAAPAAEPKKSSSAPPSDAPAASVLRMLFGNRPPPAK